MGRLDGKVALISGGSRGQGAAEAKLFALEGAKVVLADILDEEGKKVEAEINETGGDAKYVHLDVTSEDAWEAAVRETVDSYGKLDILVNNAGAPAGRDRVPVVDLAEEMWDLVIGVNLKGTFLMSQAVGRHMIQRGGGGKIINIATDAARVGAPRRFTDRNIGRDHRRSADRPTPESVVSPRGSRRTAPGGATRPRSSRSRESRPRTRSPW